MIEFSEKQKKLIRWWSDEPTEYDGVISDGAIRSGKTWGMIIGFLLWSQSEFSNQQFIVAGRSIMALKRNVINPMKNVLSSVLNWPYKENRSENFISVGTNIYYMFGASSEQSQDVLQGMTAAGCFADEVALFPKSFVEQMIGRCSVEGSKLWFNCNPANPRHYIKKEFIDKAKEKHLLSLNFTMKDNPTLSKDIIERYERMYTGVFYDRFILGKWVLAEGVVYPMYEDAIEEPFKMFETGKNGEKIQRFVDYRLSIDYGTQNPFACLKWAKDSKGIWHVVDEYYYSGRDEGHQKTDADYVRDMVDFTNDRQNVDIPVYVDPSAKSFIVAMRRCSERSFKMIEANNEVLPGIQETSTCLQKSQGLVKVSNRCKNTIIEFGNYVWDDKSDSDQPIKENDHAMDALRYFVHTMRLYRPEKPYIPLIGR